MPDEREPVDIDAIEKEILHGLPHERDRMEDARVNLRFYQGDFGDYPVRDKDSAVDRFEFTRNSLIMKRTVDTLAALLYREGPKRTLPDHPEASEWLEDCYRKNCLDALLQQADRLTFVSDVAMIQVEARDDPDCPVYLRLWDAHEFAVWCDPDEPCEVLAVATLDKYDARRRLRLWTADEVREYQTDQYNEVTKTAGATAFKFVGAVPNALGILPFTSVHYEIPTASFWTPGPGTHLRENNECVNKRLTDLFDSCRVNLNPIVVFHNVREGHVPAGAKPGSVWNLPADENASGDGARPDATYLQADPSFVDAGWIDLNNAIDHDLEMLGVPPAMVRLVQDGARSGASIVAEQLEPVKAAEARRRKAAEEEDRLAVVVLAVAGKHLKKQRGKEYTVTSDQLLKASEAPGLVLHWPSLFPKIPGTEADQGDQWMLDNGLTSRTQIVMERLHLTREEAEQHLEQTAEDIKREHKLFGEAEMEKAKTEAAAAGLMTQATADPNAPENPADE